MSEGTRYQPPPPIKTDRDIGEVESEVREGAQVTKPAPHHQDRQRQQGSGKRGWRCARGKNPDIQAHGSGAGCGVGRGRHVGKR